MGDQKIAGKAILGYAAQMKPKMLEKHGDPEWAAANEELVVRLGRLVEEIIMNQAHSSGMSIDLHWHTESDRCVIVSIQAGAAAPSH